MQPGMLRVPPHDGRVHRLSALAPQCSQRLPALPLSPFLLFISFHIRPCPLRILHEEVSGGVERP
jgi:hypothetical protein